MGWWLSLSLMAMADFAFTGKVLSLQKNPLKNNYLVTMATVSTPLEVDKGADYRCLQKALKSQEVIEFTLDSKLMKIRSCQHP